jgi:hypothetical protein
MVIDKRFLVGSGHLDLCYKIAQAYSLKSRKLIPSQTSELWLGIILRGNYYEIRE